MTQSSDLNWQRDDFANITKPFENDLLNRKPLAEHLTRYIDRLQVGAVLALDARWGEGKTWFVQHWKAYLEQTDIPHNVIYLNAFAQDYVDDPFMVLSAEITHAFDNANPDDALIKTFKESATSVAKALLPELPKLLLSLGMTLMGAGYLGKTLESIGNTVTGAIDSTKKFYGEEAFEGINEAIDTNISEAIQQRFENHEADKQTLQVFKQSLLALANNQDLNPQPLVFIIDELDRCNPLFSVRLIERIKHFFDMPNIVFVLVCDKHQLQKTICHQFGYDENLGEVYLDKFIDFSIFLTSQSKNHLNAYQNIALETLESLGVISLANNQTDSIQYLMSITVYANDQKITPRNLIKILNIFAMLKKDNLIFNQLLIYFIFYGFDYPLSNKDQFFIHHIHSLNFQFLSQFIESQYSEDMDKWRSDDKHISAYKFSEKVFVNSRSNQLYSNIKEPFSPLFKFYKIDLENQDKITEIFSDSFFIHIHKSLYKYVTAEPNLYPVDKMISVILEQFNTYSDTPQTYKEFINYWKSYIGTGFV